MKIELTSVTSTESSPLIWRQDLQPSFRSKQEVIINAPLEAVWSFSMDLTRIPEFHPRVVKVDLLSGKTLREPGASYQCHLSGGKHWCIEKDVEIIPLQKIVTVLPEDTFGISKILSDYRVETTFQSLGHRSTKVEISHYYSTTTLKAKLLNLIAKGKIARDTQATLNAAKATIEACLSCGIGVYQAAPTRRAQTRIRVCIRDLPWLLRSCALGKSPGKTGLSSLEPEKASGVVVQNVTLLPGR